MKEKFSKILIVEDVTSLAMTYAAYVRDLALDVDIVADGTTALRNIRKSPPDLLLLDVNLPDMSGINVLRQVKTLQLKTHVIVITADGSVELAVQAMREGASDFLVKPFSASQVHSALRHVRDRDDLKLATQSTDKPEVTGMLTSFIGSSAPMQAVCRMIDAASKSTATVFITGESGTGKEVCANALHAGSDRSNKPFVALNCAAIPRELLESEIFGHVKGAFTGASSDRLGAALQAHGGTLFLDEIGEMDLAFQAKILRFLETRSVQRVGEDMVRPADVRVICATNRNPADEVKAGRFREDLYYRLHVLPIEMPPLRARDRDVVALAEYFLEEISSQDKKNFSGFSDGAKSVLVSYHWPGNIRELKNVIQRLVVLNEGGVIRKEMLPADFLNSRLQLGTTGNLASFETHDDGPNSSQILPLDGQIDAAIARAIAACGGSIPKAAEALRISPSTIYRRDSFKKH